MTTPPDPQNPGVPDDPSQSGPTPGYNPPPGGYTPPPVGGGYTPPPSPGGYGTPPPSGGYGTPPPSYGSEQPNYGAPQGNYGAPQANYGAPAASAYGGAPVGQFSVGDAISYAWKRFTGNPLPWVLVSLTWLVIHAVLTGLSNPTVVSGDNFSDAVSGGSIIFSILDVFVSIVFAAALIRGALAEIDGLTPGYGDFFQFKNFGAILLTSLLLALGTLVGLILVCIGALVFMFFAWFALQFVIDRDLAPVDAIKQSFSVISKNVGPLLLLALASAGILLVGTVLCFIGLLVAYPLVYISSTYAYRFFTNGPIAPVEAAAVPGPTPYPPTQYPPQ